MYMYINVWKYVHMYMSKQMSVSGYVDVYLTVILAFKQILDDL